jgi:DNA-binding XRE family transcriptional regulator
MSVDKVITDGGGEKVDKHKTNYTLKALRAKNGLTQTDIANVVGISTAAFNQKENGIRDFTISECRKICTYFKLSPEDIFFAGEYTRV